MTTIDLEMLKRHFLEWTGGFEPDSEYQITVYVDYARMANLDPDEVRDVLTEWMQTSSHDGGIA